MVFVDVSTRIPRLLAPVAVLLYTSCFLGSRYTSRGLPAAAVVVVAGAGGAAGEGAAAAAQAHSGGGGGGGGSGRSLSAKTVFLFWFKTIWCNMSFSQTPNRPKRDPYAYYDADSSQLWPYSESDPLVIPSQDHYHKGKGEHRGKSGASTCATFVNTLKCSIGAGILSLPYGFAQAGWLGSLITFLVICIPTVYCLHRMGATRLMILEDRIREEKTSGLRADPGVTTKEIKRAARASREYLEYPELAEMSVGKRLRRLVTVLVLLGQIGTCSAYVIFITNNLLQISAIVPALASVPRFAFCLILLPFLTMLSFVKTLKGLTPAALAGLAFLVAGLSFVGVYGVTSAHSENRPLELPPTFISEGMALFAGMALFSIEAVTAMPSLQASMEKPSSFPLVLNSAAAILVVFYVTVGLGGVVLFGSKTNSVITQNMIAAGSMGHAARVLFCIMLLVTFPFQLFPAAVIVDRSLGSTSSNYSSAWNTEEGSAAPSSWILSSMRNFYAVRFALCVLVVSIGILFSDFGMFLSLIGYPCMGTLGLVIPPLMCISMDMRSKKKNGRMGSFDRAACWTIMLVGSIACILGTVYSVVEVIRVETGMSSS